MSASRTLDTLNAQRTRIADSWAHGLRELLKLRRLELARRLLEATTPPGFYADALERRARKTG